MTNFDKDAKEAFERQSQVALKRIEEIVLSKGNLEDSPHKEILEHIEALRKGEVVND